VVKPWHLDQALGLKIPVTVGVLALISRVISTVKKQLATTAQQG
jgi:hypothetical protein